MSIYPPVRDTMIRLLSTPRLDTYSKACGNSVPNGLELYRWNVDASMAFFESIHYFEVALRNSIDSAMTKWFDKTHPAGPGVPRVHWFSPDEVPGCNQAAAEVSGLNPVSCRKVREAAHRAGKRHNPVENGHIVAELTMGFWHNVLRQSAGNGMWPNALQHAFVSSTRQQRLEASVGQLVDLRNRIAHHEPIIGLDLAKEYTNLIQASEVIQPGLGWWIDATSRVETVLGQRPQP